MERILSFRNGLRSFKRAESRDSRSFNISASCSGDAKGPMCIMLFSFVVCRQIYLFFVTKIAFNEYTVGMGYPVGWIVCAILSFLYYRRSRWEEKVKED